MVLQVVERQGEQKAEDDVEPELPVINVPHIYRRRQHEPEGLTFQLEGGIDETDRYGPDHEREEPHV